MPVGVEEPLRVEGLGASLELFEGIVFPALEFVVQPQDLVLVTGAFQQGVSRKTSDDETLGRPWRFWMQFLPQRSPSTSLTHFGPAK